MSFLLLAAVSLGAGAVLWAVVASLRPRWSESLSPPVLAVTPSTEAGPGPDPIPGSAGGALAVVAVAVDEIAAAATLLGEGFGAEARAEVAAALRGAVRRRDLCTPWRDHLVVAVLPGVDVQQTPALRLRVQRALSEIRIVTHAGEEVPIGFRVASACAPGDGGSEAELLVAAEKQLARNAPASASPTDSASAQICATLPIFSN